MLYCQALVKCVCENGLEYFKEVLLAVKNEESTFKYKEFKNKSNESFIIYRRGFPRSLVDIYSDFNSEFEILYPN